MADSSVTRIVFEPYTHPDGQVQHFPEEVLRGHEQVEVEAGWLHVVVYTDWTSYRIRSYPSRVVSCVHYKRADE